MAKYGFYKAETPVQFWHRSPFPSGVDATCDAVNVESRERYLGREPWRGTKGTAGLQNRPRGCKSRSRLYVTVAQMAERDLAMVEATGSIPASHSKSV